MSVESIAPGGASHELVQLRPAGRASLDAFIALLARDVYVIRKTFSMFLLRTVMQPLLTVFVFTYVFPKVGQGIGGRQGEAAFSTLFLPGAIATACIFQGIQAVALPLVQEFGYTREIDDRVLAPLPVWGVALGKIASGAVQAVLAGVVVFPLAKFIPATPVRLDFNWPLLLTIGPLVCFTGAALGLAIGTRADTRQVPLIFSVIVVPMTFLGATYYPWARLTPIAWLKYLVLVNPLVYMSEGLRASLTGIPHMSLLAIYVALVGFGAVLAYLGISGFRKRVIS
ncbi:MAG TPA: ABC transporter permease [Acidimicrobiales bacterium]|nr:ABC transporter permease [Acidimicrobiales bacterium]